MTFTESTVPIIEKTFAGKLADPEFRRARALRAGRAAWGPDALIGRLSRANLTDAQIASLRAVLADREDRQRLAR